MLIDAMSHSPADQLDMQLRGIHAAASRRQDRKGISYAPLALKFSVDSQLLHTSRSLGQHVCGHSADRSYRSCLHEYAAITKPSRVLLRKSGGIAASPEILRHTGTATT